jgi:hypothetical protein
MTDRQRLARRMLNGSDGVYIDGRWISRSSLIRNEANAELVLSVYTPERLTVEIAELDATIAAAKERGESIMAISGYRSTRGKYCRMLKAVSNG